MRWLASLPAVRLLAALTEAFEYEGNDSEQASQLAREKVNSLRRAGAGKQAFFVGNTRFELEVKEDVQLG